MDTQVAEFLRKVNYLDTDTLIRLHKDLETMIRRRTHKLRLIELIKEGALIKAIKLHRQERPMEDGRHISLIEAKRYVESLAIDEGLFCNHLGAEERQAQYTKRLKYLSDRLERAIEELHQPWGQRYTCFIKGAEKELNRRSSIMPGL